MRRCGFAFVFAFALLIGCSAPEPELKITMAPWPKETNAPSAGFSPSRLTVREAWQARNRSYFTPFPEYDDKALGGIIERWRQQLEILPQRSEGGVILDFKMKYDGQVSDITVAEMNVPEPYVDACRKAVLEGVPYDPWPPEMRQLIGETSRPVRLRFDYRPFLGR
jgi:hypothetical protein